MTETRPEAGTPYEVAPGIRRILAPNPSPMTHWGTNTYLIGTGEVAVVDPGPDNAGHRAAILTAVGRAPVRAILVTHAHRDHSMGAPALARATGAEVMAFGPATAGRSARMAALAGHPALEGGEGLDTGFRPDGTLAHGDSLQIDGARLEALHTPGHFAGHLSLAVEGCLFSGDLVMGWASTLISPPDGDLAAFMQSCEMLRARPEARYLPGHGARIDAPHGRIDWLVAHRRAREAEILDVLGDGAATPRALAERIYHDQPAPLVRAGARNVLAHLIDLTDRGMARADGPQGPDTVYRRA